MQDVQLLVVDREDKKRICEIGEIGEIYVRVGDMCFPRCFIFTKST